MIDPRMKYFSSYKKPIYIPDINNEASAPDIEQYRHYINNVYITDYVIKNSGLISEISVPFLFQMKMPYGYLQVNSRTVMKDTSLRNIKQYAVSVDQLFTKNRIFRPSEDRFIVVNVSRKGFGIAFKDRKFIRYFKENSTVTVDMILSDNIRIPIYAVIRHISIQENKVIMVGFEILEMDALGEVAYEEFLDTVK